MGNLSVRGIHENVLAEFKNFVRERHGKLHTVMGQEVESALRFYMGEVIVRERTHTQTEEVKTAEKKKDIKSELSQEKLTMVNKVPRDVMFGSVRTTRGHKVTMDIIAQLQEMGQWNGQDLNRKLIEKLVWKYGGMDPRTIKNYTDKVMSIWLHSANWEPTLIAQAEKILEGRTYGVGNGKSEFI